MLHGQLLVRLWLQGLQLTSTHPRCLPLGGHLGRLYAEGNLPKQSVVVVSQVSSVDKARLGERIGSLSDTRVEQILAGLRFQQVSFFGR